MGNGKRRIVFVGRPEGPIRRFLGEAALWSPLEFLRRDLSVVDDLVLFGDVIDDVDAALGVAHARRLGQRVVVSFEACTPSRLARFLPWHEARIPYVDPAALPARLFGARVALARPELPLSAWAPVPLVPGPEPTECLCALTRAISFLVPSWAEAAYMSERTLRRVSGPWYGESPNSIIVRHQVALAMHLWRGGATADECAEAVELSERHLRRLFAAQGITLSRRAPSPQPPAPSPQP